MAYPRGVGMLSIVLILSSFRGTIQRQAPLPFLPGERLTYHLHINGVVGTNGRTIMSIEGSVDVRGTMTYLLRSETKAGIGPLKGSDMTESWFDPIAMRSLRFHERERRLFSTRNLQVEIYPEDKRWVDADGASGQSSTDAPLDELSFIYFLRSLPSAPDTVYQFNRHFDAARNPVVVHLMRGDTITTKVGTFATVLMEMHVRDPHRYRGEGVIRVYLSNDACRIPVRIESVIPDIGSCVLTLESYVDPVPACGQVNEKSKQPKEVSRQS